MTALHVVPTTENTALTIMPPVHQQRGNVYTAGLQKATLFVNTGNIDC